MTRYTVFSASNREDNKTQYFAALCSNLLNEMHIDHQVFNLEQLPANIGSADVYDYDNSPVAGIVEKYLDPVDKLIFILPEYNGSFPGILKLFIDAVKPQHFRGKKAALIGVSSGRSGNIRGMDHLMGILNYVKVNVYHHKLAISGIDKLVGDGDITDADTIRRMRDQLEGFTKF